MSLNQFFPGQLMQTAGIYAVTGTDISVPSFAGISAVSASNDGTFTISWPTATTNKPNIRYKVYVALGTSVPASSLFVGTNIAVMTRSTVNSIKVITMPDQLTYFVAGQVYTFGVRAEDAYSFTDTNIVTLNSTAIASGNYPSVMQSLVNQAIANNVKLNNIANLLTTVV